MELRIAWSGQGEPVLVIPGWNTAAASVLSWLPPAFLGRFRCGVVEWPGLGAAVGDPLPGSVEEYLDALAEILPGPLPVVGFCLGGGTAWALARRHPDKVRDIVLVESTLYFPAVLLPLLLPCLGRGLLRIAQGTRLGRFLVGRGILQRGIVYPDAFMNELFAFDPDVGIHYLRLSRRYSRRPPAPCPVACRRLEGEQALGALAVSWGRYGCVEGPRAVILGAGHFPAVEAPGPFFRQLEAFLTGMK